MYSFFVDGGMVLKLEMEGDGEAIRSAERRGNVLRVEDPSGNIIWRQKED